MSFASSFYNYFNSNIYLVYWYFCTSTQLNLFLYQTKGSKTYSNVHNVPIFIDIAATNEYVYIARLSSWYHHLFSQFRKWSFYLKEQQKIFWYIIIREERTYSNPYKCIQHINKTFSFNIRPHKSCLLSDSLLEMGTEMVYA